jgi:hypothetical protein
MEKISDTLCIVYRALLKYPECVTIEPIQRGPVIYSFVMRIYYTAEKKNPNEYNHTELIIKLESGVERAPIFEFVEQEMRYHH